MLIIISDTDYQSKYRFDYKPAYLIPGQREAFQPVRSRREKSGCCDQTAGARSLPAKFIILVWRRVSFAKKQCWPSDARCPIAWSWEDLPSRITDICTTVFNELCKSSQTYWCSYEFSLHRLLTTTNFAWQSSQLLLILCNISVVLLEPTNSEQGCDSGMRLGRPTHGPIHHRWRTRACDACRPFGTSSATPSLPRISCATTIFIQWTNQNSLFQNCQFCRFCLKLNMVREFGYKYLIALKQ